MVKTDSNKKVSSTTAGLIGTYIVMRQMAKSDHEKEERERKDAEAQNIHWSVKFLNKTLVVTV